MPVKEKIRLMEKIRRYGRTGLIVFLVIFVISVFAGLGVQQFNRMRTSDTGQSAGQREFIRVVTENKLGDYAIRVNGEPVTNERFAKALDTMLESFGQQAQDPSYFLEAYGQTLSYIVRQDAILQEAKKMGLKVGSEDLKKKRDEAVQQYLVGDKEPTGNLLKDIGRKLGSQREYRTAWIEYLASQGKTEADWEEDARMQVLFEKCRDTFQAEADAKAEAAALEKKQKIDEALAAGTSFSDLAVQYSDAPTDNGGDLGAIGRGLLQPEPEQVLFATPVGTISDWIEIPVGWQRFEVYAKKEAKGDEYTAAKPGIIQRLKDEHQPPPAAEGEPPAEPVDYIPTEEEIAKAYEEVSARQIILTKEDQGAASTRFRAIVDAAQYEVNDPFILAYQALNEDKLTPFHEITFENLKDIAALAAVGEGYNYEMIRAKIERAKPQEPAPAADETPDAAEPPATEEPAPDAAAADAPAATDPAADTDAPVAEGDAAPAATETASEEVTEIPADVPLDKLFDPEQPVGPIYALAIGLFLKQIQDDADGHAGYLPYYLIGKTYTDWLDDAMAAKDQPVNRDQARKEIEANLAIAADRSSYSPDVHLYRGLNQIWLDQKEEARQSLANAEKYASPAVGGIWDLIIQGYEQLDDTAKVAELKEQQNQLRQEQLKAQLEEQRRSGQGAAPPLVPQGGMPIQVPPPPQ